MKHLYLTRKVLSALFLLVLAVGSAKAQHATVSNEGPFDGAAYGQNNSYSSNGVNWYMTWDDTNLYIGVTGATDLDSVVVYIDADPLELVTSGGNGYGSTRGFGKFDTNRGNGMSVLPFRADYALAFNRNQNALVNTAASGAYAIASQSTNSFVQQNGSIGNTRFYPAQGASSRKIIIPWNNITRGTGRPDAFNWLGFVRAAGSNATRGMAPINNTSPFTGNNPTAYYFTISDTNNGTSTPPFSRASYTQVRTGANGADISLGSFDVYDFTVNNGATIIRDENASWIVRGSLRIGNGTVRTSNSTNSIIVNEDFRIYSNGSFTLNNTAPLSVGGNFIIEGGFVAGNTASITLNGGEQNIQTTGNSTTFSSLRLTSGRKTLLNDLTISDQITVTEGARLITGNHRLILGPAARLSEANNGYISGTVESKATLSAPGSYDFNNIGLTLAINRNGSQTTDYPGSTTVRRLTGTAVLGQGTSQSIKRQYQIIPTNSTGQSVNLTFEYRVNNEDERNGINNVSRLRFFRSIDNTTPFQPLGAPSTIGSSPSVVPVRYATLNNLSVVNGYFTIGDNNNPLPVELVAFTGQLEGSAVRLDWATASEKNNKGFEVQRSTGDDQWFPLGFVDGHGSTSQRNAYTLVDANAPEGKAYYRLRQIDNDGSENFSPVVTIAVPAGNAPALVLSPVPTPDVLNISGLGSGAHVAEVYDMMGKRVLTHSFNDQTTSVSVANLPSGLYVVQVQGKKSKFVKQ
ncbi:T9SS type A sorting domain-containing protein [Hymenobacter profundi]|uniref:T9SS type A sorting domain-containing protein n=1 Tax=Hymenobacter profundi TaxID=1982110 RepID=A0ABS6X5A9_9BACT|nr:T9SS type A sorting domain-containing protein [Hymenobacter profundi]MBW3130915.1 T9SS type A sorting domain-containing protein [Hymenobacter profundi]